MCACARIDMVPESERLSGINYTKHIFPIRHNNLLGEFVLAVFSSFIPIFGSSHTSLWIGIRFELSGQHFASECRYLWLEDAQSTSGRMMSVLLVTWIMRFAILRVDSPFPPAIVLLEHRPFPWVSGGFLERRIPGKNGEGSTRTIAEAIRPLEVSRGRTRGSCGEDSKFPRRPCSLVP